ncbi:MAG: zinc-binding dehydrogenase [Acidimicrobiales bacterium]|nr:zinc-binding dehydrogenase [Acidimicrobiales bacterium]
MTATFKKLVANSFSRNFRSIAEVVERELVDPGDDVVLVKNHFGGVNASDINISGGVYFSDTNFPYDLGCESAGEVVAVGRGVKDFQVGDLVVSPYLGSAYTEYLYREPSRLVKVPNVSPDAMSAINSGCTASIGLEVVGEMGSGETVLVTAAAGGVGNWAVQLAKRAGNHVIGTCSTQAKADRLKDLGCDRIILYRDEDLDAVLKEEYPDGIDLIFEQVGQATFDTCVDNVARRGRILICGFISEYQDGPQEILAPRIYHKLLWKSAQLRGFLFSDWPDRFHEHLARNMQLIEDGLVDPQIDPQAFVGVDGAVDAVEYLHSGGNTGKVVVQYQ